MADYSILISAYFSRKRWFTAVAETTRPASMLESPSLSFWRNSSTEETVTLAGAGSFPPFVVLKITYSDLCKKSVGLDKFVLHAFPRVQSVNSALKMCHIAF